MTRQKRRPVAGLGSAEVVRIGAGGIYQPDYGRIVCGQLAAARHHLGMDLPDFASLINSLTDRDAMPETMAAWEDDLIPPADVLRAAEDAAQIAPGTGPVHLITEPAAFPVEALAGSWVTAYQFTHAGKLHHHADIARIAIGPGDRIHAANHPPEPRSEGRGRAFRNEISGTLNGRHVGGEWVNTSDLRYWGYFFLEVLAGEIVMDGTYSGVGNVGVSGSRWRWVRLDAGPVPPAGFTLRDPHELHDLVMDHSETGEPLTLADVRGDD